MKHGGEYVRVHPVSLIHAKKVEFTSKPIAETAKRVKESVSTQMPNPDNTEDDNSDEEIVKQEIHRYHNEPTEEEPYILPNGNNEGSDDY